MGLKKKIFFSWVGLELVLLPLSIPATAQIIERISFAFPPSISAVELDAQPGFARYIVATNAPFNVISEGVIGDMNVSVTVSGHINGMNYGQAAQTVGENNTCATSIAPSRSIIYAADRKTAARRGDVLDQAILIEVKYDASAKPRITFEASETQDGITPPTAMTCSPIAS